MCAETIGTRRLCAENLGPRVVVMVNDYGRDNLSFDSHRRVHRHCGLVFRRKRKARFAKDARIPLDDGKG